MNRLGYNHEDFIAARSSRGALEVVCALFLPDERQSLLAAEYITHK